MRELKAGRVVEMVNESARGGDKDIRTGPQRRLLRLQVQTAWREVQRVIVVANVLS